MSTRLHVSLQLIAASDLEQVEAVLSEALCRQFDAEVVALKLLPLESDISAANPTVAEFVRFIDRERSLCGPLDAAHNGILFSEQNEAIGSAVLILVGSRDLDRFGADIGTDLLDRLGEIVSRKLQALHQLKG